MQELIEKIEESRNEGDGEHEQVDSRNSPDSEK